jgi:DNA invertase Pin-like site-specific DNA recombinase
MEAVLTQEDHERIASLAAAKTFGLIKDFLKPEKEQKIKDNKSYSVSEVAELFDVTTHTIRRWFEEDKHCLLRKVKNVNKFSGPTVKAEYERRNGIQ